MFREIDPFGKRTTMKELVIFGCLLSAVAGYVAHQNHGRVDSVWAGDGGIYGGGQFGGDGGGRFGGDGIFGGPISRDVHEQEPVDGSQIVDEINLLLEKANKSITANELLASADRLKSLSQTWLDTQQQELSNEAVDNYIKEILSQFKDVPTLDLLNADALGDEAYRVNLILQMLKRSADDIKRAEGVSYGHIVRFVSILADKLATATENSVDLYKIILYNNQAQKRDINRRQGTWTSEIIPGKDSIGEKLTYENGPFKAYGIATQGGKGKEEYQGGINYSKGPWSVGGGVTYNPNSGINGGLNFGYTKDNVNIGGSYGYDPQSGSNFKFGGTWRFKK